AASTFFPGLARADPFVPNETQVSTALDMYDIEYSSTRAMYARVDDNGHLWVGNINRANGDYIDPTGREILPDSNTMNISDLIWFYPGPEWVSTPDGDQVVYTKTLPGKKHTAANTRIGLAFPAPNGQWSGGQQGPDVPRFDIFGSDTDGG